MTARRPLLILAALLALVLAVPAAPARAQDPTPEPTISQQFPGGGSGEEEESGEAPAEEEESEDRAQQEEESEDAAGGADDEDADAAAKGRLADTGADPLGLALAGLGLLALGYGLRISLAPGGRLAV